MGQNALARKTVGWETYEFDDGHGALGFVRRRGLDENALAHEDRLELGVLHDLLDPDALR